MSECYYEKREKTAFQSAPIMADIIRHFHLRQYLGKTIIVGDNPTSLLRIGRKQWLKLARAAQRERSSTINADKILRFTYAITHMQRLHFSTAIPSRDPNAHIYFLTPEQLKTVLPLDIYTLYITTTANHEILQDTIKRLPQSGLIVDYADAINPKIYNLKAKIQLEEQLQHHWEQIKRFFEKHELDIHAIASPESSHVDIMDNTLDTLLGVSHDFLRLAGDFQHALELAQPLKLQFDMQKLFNTLTLLAYRVQALSPGSVDNYILRTYHEKETFFLHDVITDISPEEESLEETINRHQEAGRSHLAVALLTSVQRHLHVPH